MPGIPCKTWSFIRCEIAGLKETPKNELIVVEKALVCIDREEFLGLLCYFHLVISLAKI